MELELIIPFSIVIIIFATVMCRKYIFNEKNNNEIINYDDYSSSTEESIVEINDRYYKEKEERELKEKEHEKEVLEQSEKENNMEILKDDD